MTNQHPVTPPPDKIHNWLQLEKVDCTLGQIITIAAQWGADQELEACIAWFDKCIPGYELVADRLRAARRPKPSSLKEQALQVLRPLSNPVMLGTPEYRLYEPQAEIIRRALEALPND
jgi:hypothetical protein